MLFKFNNFPEACKVPFFVKCSHSSVSPELKADCNRSAVKEVLMIAIGKSGKTADQFQDLICGERR